MELSVILLKEVACLAALSTAWRSGRPIWSGIHENVMELLIESVPCEVNSLDERVATELIGK